MVCVCECVRALVDVLQGNVEINGWTYVCRFLDVCSCFSQLCWQEGFVCFV